MRKLSLFLCALSLMWYVGCLGLGQPEEITIKGVSLRKALDWIEQNQTDGHTYIIELSSDETISSAISFGTKENITIITIVLQGDGSRRTLQLEGNGNMFNGGNESVTLVLGSNITLKGTNQNTDYLLIHGGDLIINDGAEITGNRGGGVYVVSGSTFTMNGGIISNNSVYSLDNSTYRGNGVSVYGTFTMSGGTISGNEYYGVYVGSDGMFTMSGGNISNNSSLGVYVIEGGTFTQDGGTIRDSDGGMSFRP